MYSVAEKQCSVAGEFGQKIKAKVVFPQHKSFHNSQVERIYIRHPYFFEAFQDKLIFNSLLESESKMMKKFILSFYKFKVES